ncbi:MAG: RidA family protein [Acidimicrobiia bacterium]|nr:RidA family protein [Acidimicrobiia bacterium]
MLPIAESWHLSKVLDLSRTSELRRTRRSHGEQAFVNLRAIIEAAGGTLADIAKVTCFVNDRTTRDAINHQWTLSFPHPEQRPARHTLVQQLPPGVHVQLDFVAFIAENP